MTKEELKQRVYNACECVRSAEGELTEIDAKFGDADHGYTMSKIVNTIEKTLKEADGNIKEMLDDTAMAVMVLNGGSAVPLWNTWLDGWQEGAPESDEMTVAEIKAMFQTAFETLDDFSGAKVGDKTLMDALIPASETIAAYTGDSEDELFKLAAEAAVAGAENSKNFKSKFGRAKSYGDQTIGTPDAGAVSMSRFFVGLAK
ncbi:MAG: DAK2 domain-containing protein [Oscillospiraceae bacterium]|nr:DAK2 domain-containing protein [Oscillospiraceae bacterium]